MALLVWDAGRSSGLEHLVGDSPACLARGLISASDIAEGHRLTDADLDPAPGLVLLPGVELFDADAGEDVGALAGAASALAFSVEPP